MAIGNVKRRDAITRELGWHGKAQGLIGLGGVIVGDFTTAP